MTQENKLTLLRAPDGTLVLLAATHRKWAEVIVRSASDIWVRHVPAAEIVNYTPVDYSAPQDVLAERFLADSLPGVHRTVSPRVYAELAKHGL